MGEGFYGILTHHGHTHLCYVLEQPSGTVNCVFISFFLIKLRYSILTKCLLYFSTYYKEPGDAQKTFNIVKEGSYIINAKNPDYVDPRYPRSEKKVEMPVDLKDIFRDRKWAPSMYPPLYHVFQYQY